MNRITQTRFGDIEYNNEMVLRFPEGMLGFEGLHDYVVVPGEKDSPLTWIQSIEDADVAFVLTDPTNFFPEYRVEPDEQERAQLALANQDDECFVLSVVTVHQDRQITLNLQAPVLYAPSSQRAVQVVLEGSPYSTRHNLPS